jgi:hypothetical protein
MIFCGALVFRSSFWFCLRRLCSPLSRFVGQEYHVSRGQDNKDDVYLSLQAPRVKKSNDDDNEDDAVLANLWGPRLKASKSKGTSGRDESSQATTAESQGAEANDDDMVDNTPLKKRKKENAGAGCASSSKEPLGFLASAPGPSQPKAPRGISLKQALDLTEQQILAGRQLLSSFSDVATMGSVTLKIFVQVKTKVQSRLTPELLQMYSHNYGVSVGEQQQDL